MRDRHSYRTHKSDGLLKFHLFFVLCLHYKNMKQLVHPKMQIYNLNDHCGGPSIKKKGNKTIIYQNSRSLELQNRNCDLQSTTNLYAAGLFQASVAIGTALALKWTTAPSKNKFRCSKILENIPLRWIWSNVRSSGSAGQAIRHWFFSELIVDWTE